MFGDVSLHTYPVRVGVLGKSCVNRLRFAQEALSMVADLYGGRRLHLGEMISSHRLLLSKKSIKKACLKDLRSHILQE